MPIELAASVLVILAGGKSSRFGEPKGLKPVQGQPLITWQAGRFKAAGGGKVVVVLGHHAETYRAGLAGSMDEFVVNPAPERGSFTSLQCGLSVARPGATGAVFVLPVDVPAPGPQIWRMLAKPDRDDFDAVVPEIDGRGGHPVRLSIAFAAKLREIPWQAADARLDLQLKQISPSRYLRVAVDDVAIRLNLNTLADFQAWESSLDKPTAPQQ